MADNFWFIGKGLLDVILVGYNKIVVDKCGDKWRNTWIMFLSVNIRMY